MNIFKITDDFLRNIDDNKRFENIDVLLSSIGLTEGQKKSVDELILDIAQNAIQKGFFDGVRCERDKGEIQ